MKNIICHLNEIAMLSLLLEDSSVTLARAP